MMLNNDIFLLKEVPDYHPLSPSYISAWREIKRKTIEGYWAGGYYMPPALYFYANLGTIRLNKPRSNVKTFGRPWLRDLEWYTFRYYTEASGFSGFELDDVYSSNYLLLDPYITDEYLLEEYPETINSQGQRKKFVHPREALEMWHPYHKGRAIFHNPVSNFLMMGSRNTGKSFMVGAGILPHKFLTDGATEYTEHAILNPSPVELLVGAVVSDKSADLLKKTKDCLDFLPGKRIISGRSYPSPLSKKYTGSWAVNSEIIAQYKKKTPGGKPEDAGSKSSIKHRSFNENPFAAQGTRPVILAIEEIGLVSNLEEIYGHTVDNLKDGNRKTGMLMMLGTGGDMEKGTIPSSKMFYEPEKYSILPFDDVWENPGKKIAYFIPAYLSLNEFKDKEGNTNIEKAKQALLDNRLKLRTSSGGSDALNKEMQYKPLVPSEIFLSKSANIFPVAELRSRLSTIQAQNLYDYAEKKVDLRFDHTVPYGVSYDINHNNEAISTYPFDGDNREGTVVIYEFPKYNENNTIPDQLYIIGCDPFKDDTNEGGSLASIYVMKTHKHPLLGHNEIVASYIGRPYLGKNKVNEILFQLSLFYGNAKIYFENNVGNVKDYFEKIKRLDLLASQPVTVFNRKASYNTGPVLTYGYQISNDKVKWEAIQYLRAWLLEPREDNKRNVDYILDPGLLQELISFRMDGNFDRVMSLVGCIIGMEEIHNLMKRKQDNSVSMSQFSKDMDRLIINNPRLFAPQTTQQKMFA